MRRTSFLYLFRDQQGIVLVVALMLMGLMSALAAAYSTMIRADTVLRGAAGRERQGFYAAENGLNVAMATTRTRFDNFNPPPPGTTSPPITDRFTVGSGAQQRTVDTELRGVTGCEPCPRETIGAGQPFAGLSSIPYRYSLTSTAKNSANEEEAKLGAEFTVHTVPIFQFLAFYTNNLYIMPLEAMPLNGRIHTNGNLRLNDTGNTLSIADSPTVPLVQVSAGGNIFRGANKYGGWTCSGGSVLIDRRSDLMPLALDPCGSISTPVPQTNINAYLGSVLAGVPPIQTPLPQRMARGPAAANLYWNYADLRIVLDLTATLNNDPDYPCGPPAPGLFRIVVQDQNGNRDVTKTRALWRFMCQRRGAIFYTDVPNGAGASGTGLSINDNDSDTDVSELRTDYNPNFSNDTYVYRRVGEDTNGNGIINASDRNRDICPVSDNYPAGAADPWWKPLDCPWPYDIPGVAPSTVTTADDMPASVNSWFRDTDYRRGGFYNRREDRWMYLLNVNVRALLEWNARPIDAAVLSNSGGGNALISAAELGNDNNGGGSDGGVILYLSVQGPNSLAVAPGAANNYGVRIFDSADLDTTIPGATFPFPLPADPTGITIVSDQAAYIEGNFNSTHKYPVAIMADALNVLSQAWEIPMTGGAANAAGIANDRKSTDILANRFVLVNDFPGGSAINPRINAAFIAGVGPSPLAGAGNYDGGLENYPRFHESWTGRPLTVSGAFVSLGRSLHAVNEWAFGSGTTEGVYNPPDRPWNYDSDFNNVALLPPMTPTITWIQQRMYTRFYQ